MDRHKGTPLKMIGSSLPPSLYLSLSLLIHGLCASPRPTGAHLSRPQNNRWHFWAATKSPTITEKETWCCSLLDPH